MSSCWRQLLGKTGILPSPQQRGVPRGFETKVSSLAAHVPDLVVYSPLTKEVPSVEHFYGVLLFADVSGFTALTEKFSHSSKKGYGADELTHTLNSYIGEIVNYILAAGGDVLNYAGDAILALWKAERTQLSDIIFHAVRCSLNIQDECGIRETKVGCQLRVKIGISAGKLSKAIVGDEGRQHFVVIGRAVDEVRLAEGLAEASTIILSPNAWELCDRDNIVIERIENERAIKVRYIKRQPHFSVENFISAICKDVEHEHPHTGCLRKASRLKPDKDREEFLRKYIMKPVLKKLDEAQPLECLSEMRPVTIVFMNLQFTEPECHESQCSAIHTATVGISHYMQRHHGRINKVFTFDKGCTFLCLFGLPGDKREDESANALEAAYGSHTFCLTEIKSLRTASVGVTTGPVFCGVIGHCLRHEYTVIGRKVNLAARLMMHYPGMVSCDNETLHNSRLPSFYFSELPKTAMKGVRNPGPIFKFTIRTDQISLSKAPVSVCREEGCPLIGREKEMEVFSRALRDFLEARDSGDNSSCNVVIYEGATGFGKTRLLAECIYRTGQEGVRAISCELSKAYVRHPNYTFNTLLALLLSVQNCKSYAERERVILSKVQEPELSKNLCLLNHVLQVKFPISKAVALMDNETKNTELKNYCLRLFCKMVEEEPCVIVVDQAHFVDQASWSLLIELCERAPVLVCLSLLPHTSQSDPFPELSRIVDSPRTLYLKLPTLQPPLVAQLACQMLSVVRIPTEVELFLVERSHGVPFYCVELLRSLCLSKMILIKAVEEEANSSDFNMMFPGPPLVQSSKNSAVDDSEESGDCSPGQRKTSLVNLEAPVKSRSTDHTFVCVVRKAANLHEIPIPLTLKGMALARLDHLQPAEQMIVKYAAVIGHTFSRQTLSQILPDVREQKLDICLVSLFNSATFECASKTRRFSLEPSTEGDRWSMLDCYCDGKKGDNDYQTGLACVNGVWQCTMMRFCMALLKDTAYELWPEEQKREIHWKCASFLMNCAHRCEECDTDEFIFGHRAAINHAKIKAHDPDSRERKLSSQRHPRLRRGAVQLSHISLTSQISEEEHLLVQFVDDCEIAMQTDSSRGCGCSQVVDSVLCPMVRHWMGVGDVQRTFYYLLEMAAASCYLSQNLKALSYLNEAEMILHNLKEGKPAFETADPKYKVKICNFERACVFRLRGEMLFITGQILQAEKMFVKALKFLNRRIPENAFAVSLKYMFEKMRSGRYRYKRFEIPEKRKLAFLNEQICCLSYMWQISCMRHLPRNALLAITMETNCAILSAEEFQIISSSIDYLQCSHIVGMETQHELCEHKLWTTFSDLSPTTEGLVLFYHFMRSLTIVRLCCGDLKQSIQCGATAHRISKLMNHPSLGVWIITVLHVPLLLTYRYSECVQLLHSLEHLGDMTNISTAKGWFYSACFDFILYAGFAFRPFAECLTFVEDSQSDPNLVTDRSLMMNLYSALALWYVRLHEWERAHRFYCKAYRLSRELPVSIHSCRGVVMFLECSVLLFGKALVDRSTHAKTIYRNIQKQLCAFSQLYSSYKIFLPQFLHLKAYMCMLVGHDALARHNLMNGLQLCKKQGNTLVQSRIKHSQDVWFGNTKQGCEDWLVATLNMPSWDKAAQLDPEGLQHYHFL
ncbi:adenylate cyclase type 10-like [Chanos chanos]|uniref:Adenylate cyclase type 10-like n=1 Tax=Chanos chanos TaxID=29144 RepID=A0A6J2UWW5_CHACN|nr:adenylate cyclase type 10 [Chanos chanos]